jgi:CRP-like cAMP-binding protein
MQMQHMSNTGTGNRLLDALGPASLERLQPYLEPVELVVGERLPPVKHVYFPSAGLISIAATMHDGAAVDVGMMGPCGMYGIAAILSDDAPFHTARVQLPGRALRIKSPALRRAMHIDGALRKLLLRYVQAMLSAVAQTAACNRLHVLEQRCARWLLACHDRAEGDKFPMTYGFLAMMLGVGKPGAAVAARALEEHALISYQHGSMAVLDREGLEAAACECYRAIWDEFDRVLTAAPLFLGS